jgi:hypothetical protein
MRRPLLPFQLLALMLAGCLPAAQPTRIPASFGDLMHINPDELGRLDIGRVNLLCAQGLPGEYMDLDGELAILDRWSESVRKETKKFMSRFRAHPEKFKGSEGYFRMLVLITLLQQDFGVDYNPARDTSPENPESGQAFFANSADLFVHGLLGKRLGTCSSMPVLYVAVGRRLGYPLKLVTAKSHLFARWNEGDGRHFNIEGTNRGLVCHEDDYYKTWPRPISEAELANGQFLKSLTPAEEMGVFLQIRGICLQVNGRYAEAKATFDRAVELVPSSELYARFANQKMLTSKN